MPDGARRWDTETHAAGRVRPRGGHGHGRARVEIQESNWGQTETQQPNKDTDMPTPIVQIFPMSDDYLSLRQTIGDFFLNDLLIESSRRPTVGRFNFKTTGVAAPLGSLLLFQYQGQIRAHGRLVGRGRKDRHSPHDSNGFFLLEQCSVHFCRTPVTLAELQGFWPKELGGLQSLNQWRWKLDPGKTNAYLALARTR